jgi:hypothetical protein
MIFYQVLNKSLNSDRTALKNTSKSTAEIDFSLEWCFEILADMKGDEDSDSEDGSSELSDVWTLRLFLYSRSVVCTLHRVPWVVPCLGRFSFVVLGKHLNIRLSRKFSV